MEKRYHMKTIAGNQFIEAPHSVIGKQFMIGLRTGRPELFKGQRIKDVLQAHPSKVAIGELVNYS